MSRLHPDREYRSPTKRTFAAIDIGTNTARLLIAEIDPPGSLKTISAENRITRLGEGFSEVSIIRPAAMERTLSALLAFRKKIDKVRIDGLVVVGTSALRNANNRDVLLAAIERDCGFQVSVLSGEEEARCTALGVSLIFEDRDQPKVAIDIGGGSTELIEIHTRNRPFTLSIDLGAVPLTEKYLRSDPADPLEVAALQKRIKGELEKACTRFPKRCCLIGTGGTITTLAAIDQRLTRYDPRHINRYALTDAAVIEILENLAKIPLAARRQVSGLERGREDLIVAGGWILKTVMEHLGHDLLYVSDYGLREGILMDLYDKNTT
ncbi:MAG: hypothetical protein ACE5GK_06510 [Nitrospiria bacterium]